MATAPQSFPPLPKISRPVADWVESIRDLTQPAAIHWCEGSDAEYSSLIGELSDKGELQKLNSETFPNCYLARSHPSDVARVEHLTFVCTTQPRGRRPEQQLDGARPRPAPGCASCSSGCMKGRTLYVVPYCMGPIDSPYSRCGVEITDSAYVVDQHVADDAHGPRRARAHRARRRQVREGPAFHGRTRPESPLHHAFPRGSRDRELRLAAMAATRCSARNATRCASPASRRATKAGSPSTC